MTGATRAASRKSAFKLDRLIFTESFSLKLCAKTIFARLMRELPECAREAGGANRIRFSADAGTQRHLSAVFYVI